MLAVFSKNFFILQIICQCHALFSQIPGMLVIYAVVYKVTLFFGPTFDLFLDLFNLFQKSLLDQALVVSLRKNGNDVTHCSPHVFVLPFFLRYHIGTYLDTLISGCIMWSVQLIINPMTDTIVILASVELGAEVGLGKFLCNVLVWVQMCRFLWQIVVVGGHLTIFVFCHSCVTPLLSWVCQYVGVCQLPGGFMWLSFKYLQWWSQ